MCVNESYQCLIKNSQLSQLLSHKAFQCSAEVCMWEDNMVILGTHLILNSVTGVLFDLQKHQHKKCFRIYCTRSIAHSPCALYVSQHDSGVKCHWHLQLSQGVFQIKPVLNILYMFWTLCICLYFRFFLFCCFTLFSKCFKWIAYIPTDSVGALLFSGERFYDVFEMLQRCYSDVVSPCVFILLYNRCNLICKWNLTRWRIKKINLYVNLFWKETHLLIVFVCLFYYINECVILSGRPGFHF